MLNGLINHQPLNAERQTEKWLDEGIEQESKLDDVTTIILKDHIIMNLKVHHLTKWHNFKDLGGHEETKIVRSMTAIKTAF